MKKLFSSIRQLDLMLTVGLTNPRIDMRLRRDNCRVKFMFHENMNITDPKTPLILPEVILDAKS